ncbi:hypothetical protein BMS3Bbin10_01714 [bacterium BMS3Bbin10]|nr:hypothetical protein BMS3Bbin10_01714 [bacterium BMS3Bbin10]HDL16845.1 YgcG family protein [Hyphomicrobiales bacterium]
MRIIFPITGSHLSVIRTRLSAPLFASLPVAVFLFAFGLLFTGAPAAQPVFPELTGRVVDNANLLSAADESQLVSDLEAHEAKSTDQVVVVTLPSLQGYEIEEFGYQLGRHWGIGQKGKDNGVLLIVAPKERKVRIEVGRRLEPLLTDALSKLIIENGILPRFRDGDVAGGIKAGVRDILAVLAGDAQELTARAQAREDVPDAWVTIFIVMVWLIISISVTWSIIMSIRYGYQVTTGSKKRSGGSSWGSGGGWSSGGGGFSGGGGGFGGGGSSGGW